jgi:hypothetical protein
MLDMSIQSLIDSGMAWRLEGFVGRQCMSAIEAGEAVLGPEPHRDYYGNRVPSRHEVVPGTKGSVLFHHNAVHETAYKNCSPCKRLRKEGRTDA